jgi:hypothetical protein
MGRGRIVGTIGRIVGTDRIAVHFPVGALQDLAVRGREALHDPGVHESEASEADDHPREDHVEERLRAQVHAKVPEGPELIARLRGPEHAVPVDCARGITVPSGSVKNVSGTIALTKLPHAATRARSARRELEVRSRLRCPTPSPAA